MAQVVVARGEVADVESGGILNFRNQPGRGTVKRDVAAIGGDAREFRRKARGKKGSQRKKRNWIACARGGERGYVGSEVANENVRDAVGVVGNQVVGGAFEGDVTAIGGEDALFRFSISAEAVGGKADENGGVIDEVAEKEIAEGAGGGGNEIGGGARKEGELAVGGNGEWEGIGIGTAGCGRIDADERNRAGLAIAEEDVHDGGVGLREWFSAGRS